MKKFVWNLSFCGLLATFGCGISLAQNYTVNFDPGLIAAMRSAQCNGIQLTTVQVEQGKINGKKITLRDCNQGFPSNTENYTASVGHFYRDFKIIGCPRDIPIPGGQCPYGSFIIEPAEDESVTFNLNNTTEYFSR